MNETATAMNESQVASMNYYVTLHGDIVLGPFDDEITARENAMDEATRMITQEDDASFGENFHVEPEWMCVNDPRNRWNIHHIHMDNHFSVAEYDTEWEVGVFNSDGYVVDDKITTVPDFRGVLAALCSYAVTEHANTKY